MARKLINKNNIQKYLNEDRTEIVITDEMLLSPTALDYIKEYKIKRVYKKEEEKSESKADINRSKTAVITMVKRLLKDEYKITNQEKLDGILNEVMKEIDRRNINGR